MHVASPPADNLSGPALIGLQIFGDQPPQALYISRSRSYDQDLSELDPAAAEMFGTYQRSLQSMLDLAEHDKDRLGDIFDELDCEQGLLLIDDPDNDERSDLSSHQTRRKRAAKLSRFFGETGIDFTSPSAAYLPASSAVGGMPGSATTGRKSRRGTFDAMLSEIWAGVQMDTKRGRMSLGQAGRLAEMMSQLRGRNGSQD